MMKNIKSLTLLAVMALLLISCTDDAEKTNSTGDHVWKTQTDALQSAKDMAKKMQESLKQQQEIMNENN